MKNVPILTRFLEIISNYGLFALFEFFLAYHLYIIYFGVFVGNLNMDYFRLLGFRLFEIILLEII